MPSYRPSADLLFGSQVLPQVLDTILNAPGRRFGWTDLNRSLAGANRDSVYRALDRAVELGLVRRESKGRYGIYSANVESPIYRDIRRLLGKLETRRHGSGTYAPETLTQLARSLRQQDPLSDHRLPSDAQARILQFVDDFRTRRRSIQRKLLEQKPPRTGSALIDAYLAAIAEYLSSEVGLTAPAWVEDPNRFLKTWWIEGDVPSARPTAFAQSPAPFRRRGIFVSERALERA